MAKGIQLWNSLQVLTSLIILLICDIPQRPEKYDLSEHFSLLFVQPLMSSSALRDKAYEIFEEVTGMKARHDTDTVRHFHITDSHIIVSSLLPSIKTFV